MSLSRWLFSCWSTLIYQILDHETSHWFMALALPSLLPFAKVYGQTFLVWAPWWTFITVDFVCWPLRAGPFIRNNPDILKSCWANTLRRCYLPRDQTVTKKMVAVTFKFSRVSHMNTLVPRQVGHRDAAGWYLLDISTWISPRHFTLRHTSSQSPNLSLQSLSLFFIYVIFSFTQSRNLESSGVFSFLSSFPPSPPLLSKSVIRFWVPPPYTLNHCSLWQLQCYLLPLPLVHTLVSGNLLHLQIGHCAASLIFFLYPLPHSNFRVPDKSEQGPLLFNILCLLFSVMPKTWPNPSLSTSLPTPDMIIRLYMFWLLTTSSNMYVFTSL